MNSIEVQPFCTSHLLDFSTLLPLEYHIARQSVDLSSYSGMLTASLIVPLLASVPEALGLIASNGVGRLPALGWNSWNVRLPI